MPEWMVTWSGWVVASLVSIVAFRANVRFDVNEWLRDRRAQREKNLMMLCPHVSVSKEDGEVLVRSAHLPFDGNLEVLFGGTKWKCQVCGHTTYDEVMIKSLTEYWASHPVELKKRDKRFMRAAKKLGYF